MESRTWTTSSTELLSASAITVSTKVRQSTRSSRSRGSGSCPSPSPSGECAYGLPRNRSLSPRSRASRERPCTESRRLCSAAGSGSGGAGAAARNRVSVETTSTEGRARGCIVPLPPRPVQSGRLPGGSAPGERRGGLHELGPEGSDVVGAGGRRSHRHPEQLHSLHHRRREVGPARGVDGAGEREVVGIELRALQAGREVTE